MIRVVIYFEGSSSTPIELAGLSKRINAIGLQPIPGDQFYFEDLTREDKDKLEEAGGVGIKSLVVTSRLFRFESTYPAIYITLKSK
jgi:hypothetical protein